MNQASELFNKIIVDGIEIDLQQLDENNGKYNIGEQKSNVRVDFIFKNKEEIPEKLFTNTNIKKITIPESFKTIGNEAFAYTSLSYINLPSYISIGKDVFKDVENLPEEVIENITYNNPYALYNYINNIDALDLENSISKNILIESSEVANLYSTNKPYFKNVVIKDAEINSTISVKALENITFDGITGSGDKGATNGKITFTSYSLNIKNVTVGEETTIYNLFEGSQVLNDSNYHGIFNVNVENVNINCPAITHNIINVYTPATGANIVIKDSTFNLDVNNSNVLRMANYMNSENVTITFDNVEWNYETAANENSDWKCAGLMIFQPASQDVSLTGDYSKLATWTINFNNCKYNGQDITGMNVGGHNQLLYFYNLNENKKCVNPLQVIEGITININGVKQEPETYTAEEAAAYNTTLDGALQYGTVKVEGVEAVEGVEGVKYTQEEIDAATIVAGKTTEDWKVEPVEAVEAQEAVLYTKEEIDAHNAEVGMWDENTIKDEEVPAVADSWTLNGKTYATDPTYEEFTEAITPIYDYIYDETSWNTSYQSGGLHVYYEMNPFEDLWSETLQRNATINDRRCDFISYGDAEGTNEYATGTVQALVYGPWAGTNYHKVKVVSNSIDGFIGNEYYITTEGQTGPTLVGDTLYELFTDSALSQGTGIYVKITRDYYPGFTQCWDGAIKANGAKYPWIVVHFEGVEKDLQSIITFKYDGKSDVQPWGSTRLFGNGYASDGTTKLKIWGCASLPEEFQDNTFLIPENASAANPNWNGEAGEESTFDISKFTLVLEHPGVEFIEGSEAIPATHYTEEEITEHNLQLDIWKEGKVKTEAVEAVEAVEGVNYTQEEIDAATIVAGKTTEDWKVEPVEAVEAVEEVLYTNEEVDAYNAQLTGAVKEGDIKK